MQKANPVSFETRSAAIKMVAAGTGVRIAMRGTSMLPDLREGMVLEIRSEIAPKTGDIIVFRAGRKLVAHRAVAIESEAITCAGDAQPDSIEYVPRANIVGVVQHVYDAQGRRVDTPGWRLRGMLRARIRPLRALSRDVLPHARPRAYVSLFNAMAAFVGTDDRALAEAIRQERPGRLVAIAQRHRCAAALCAALERLHGDDVANALRARLRKDRWTALVRQTRLASQLERVVRILRSSDIEPILLKGAQRNACGTPEAALFDSHDIDVLVPPTLLDAACDALRRAGYRQDPHPLLDYDRHHHAAPFFAKDALPVELHRALSVFALDLPNSWSDLRHHTRIASSRFGPVTVLDPAASAVHLAVHCLQRPALRELVLLARHLQKLDAYELATVRGMLSRERRYAIPLHGAMLLASRLAGVEWTYDERAQRFAAWMLLREDLPRPLRARTESVDAWLAGVPPPAAGDVLRGVLRVFAGIAIAMYAPFMRK